MTSSTYRPENDQRNRGGLRLFRQLGHGIEWVRGDDFLVPSRSKKTRLKHEVNLRLMSCTCEDHTLGGHRCAHLIAATIWIAKHLTAKRREAEKLSNVRRERPSPSDFAQNIERMAG